MNNQKDTQKHSLNHYGHSNVLDIKSFVNNNIFDFACKKTEKLVTALYMVSDCMDTDDALKSKLRQLGVELLSDIYKLPSYSPMNKYDQVSISLSRIYEIISFVGIANTMGFVSDMNTAILRKEFGVLIKELESHQTKDKHFTFTLDQGMFRVPSNQFENNHHNGLKDTSMFSNKRTVMNGMSFINNKQNGHSSLVSNLNSHDIAVSEKKDRMDKIIILLKDSELSIKDIANNFTNCSEKTIQRELNSLISKGQVKKVGSKRWSKYGLVVKS